jgi:signal transduction histidine kinase
VYLIFLLIEYISQFLVFITFLLYFKRKEIFFKQVIIGGFPIISVWSIITQFSSNSIFNSLNHLDTIKQWLDTYIDIFEVAGIVWFILFFSWLLFVKYNILKKESAQKSIDNERFAKEKEIERNQLIEMQKKDLEKRVEERTVELKASQAQLIQSEKLASLGELTAGIAHEIQNPLNFVNNFSELSVELAKEINEEIDKDTIDKPFVKELMGDLTSNQQKINHHGQRASAIVKGMLEHSRASTGTSTKVATDLNSLADEYLRLAYHGLRAKDDSFNATLETHFDPDLPLVSVIPQDIGRVILNLINNAFYAVNEKAKQGIEGYSPTVSVSTRKLTDAIEIRVKDNGNGIPDAIKDKIFQPFFTTKPTGQGTGLGLSLAYDIVTKGHSGEIKVNTKENEGTEFIIQLHIGNPFLKV